VEPSNTKNQETENAAMKISSPETGAVRQIADLHSSRTFGGAWKPEKQWKPLNFAEEPMARRRPPHPGTFWSLFSPLPAK
jgi:hypothetical protein